MMGNVIAQERNRLAAKLFGTESTDHLGASMGHYFGWHFFGVDPEEQGEVELMKERFDRLEERMERIEAILHSMVRVGKSEAEEYEGWKKSFDEQIKGLERNLGALDALQEDFDSMDSKESQK